MKNERRPSWERIEVAIAVFLSLLLVGLHLLRWHWAGPLWRDEISSLTLATRPTWRALWHTLVFDPFPAFFFVLLRAWHGLVGSSDRELRLLGILVGLAIIGALWLTARLTHRGAPSWSLLLIGFSPTLIIWGDTLRAYGVGVFWIVLSFACFWRLLEKASWWTFACATLAAVMSVQSAFTNSLLIFALATAVSLLGFSYRRWRGVLGALAAGAIAALSLLPYVPTILATLEWSSLNQGEPRAWSQLETAMDAMEASGGSSIYLWLFSLLALVLIVLPLSLRNESARPGGEVVHRRTLFWYSFISLLIGWVSTFLFFHKIGWNCNVWYFLPALALAAVAIDTASSTRAILPYRALGVVLILGFLAPEIWNVLHTRVTNLDLVANVLSRRAGPNDLVVVYPFSDGITFHRYLPHTMPWVTVPPVSDHSLHNWDEILAEVKQPKAMQPVLQEVKNVFDSGGRIWLVSSLPLAPPKRPPPEEQLHKIGERSLLNVCLITWSSRLTYALSELGGGIERIPIPSSQPISVYEDSRVFLVSPKTAAVAAK